MPGKIEFRELASNVNLASFLIRNLTVVMRVLSSGPQLFQTSGLPGQEEFFFNLDVISEESVNGSITLSTTVTLKITLN